MQLAGDTTWYVAPVDVVSTKYVEPLRTSAGANAAPASLRQIADAAETPSSSAAPVCTETKEAPPKPVKKTVSTPKP